MSTVLKQLLSILLSILKVGNNVISVEKNPTVNTKGPTYLTFFLNQHNSYLHNVPTTHLL